jgi:hypothetical protein
LLSPIDFQKYKINEVPKPYMDDCISLKQQAIAVASSPTKKSI